LLLGGGMLLWTSGRLAVMPRNWAQDALTENRLEDAERWLDWARALSPEDAQNALLSARIARHRGDPERLGDQLDRARLWGADETELERERLLALAQAGELDLAEDQLFDWLASGDREADEISDALANGLAAAGRFEEAISVIDAWRKDYPEDPRCDYRLGRIFEHQERYDDAEERYREALVKCPRYYPAAFSLGRVMLHQKRGEEAEKMYRYCLQMGQPAAAKIELAVALKSLGKSDEARELLREVLDLGRDAHTASYASVDENPEGYRAAAEYGRLEADAGNFEKAVLWLRTALRANPLDLTVRYSLGVALRGSGNLEEAEKHFAHVRQAREAMGEANSLNERIKREPGDVEARYKLGKLILENESERIGLYWLRSIFAHDPDYRPAHVLLADYYQRKADSANENSGELRRRAEFHRRAAARQADPSSATDAQ
jgi:FimV-like protein